MSNGRNTRLPSYFRRVMNATQRGVQNLRNGNVNIRNNATLDEVVDAIPQVNGTAQWTFDPLIVWNGENIEQMWENDPRKDDYLFRAIYVINGAFDRQNFLANTATAVERNALAFETSDGVFYPAETRTELWHEWDASQDVLDSQGNPVRYVKVYSDIAITPTNTPYFNETSRYVIYGLNNNATVTSTSNFFYQQRAMEYFYSPSLEGIATVGSGSKYILYMCSNLRYINLPALTSTTTTNTSYVLSYNYSLTTINLPALTSISSSSTGTNISGYVLSHNYSLTTINLPALTSISSSISSNNNGYVLSYNYSLTTINLPALTSISSSSGNSYVLSHNYSLLELYQEHINTFEGNRIFRHIDNFSMKVYSLPTNAISAMQHITLTNAYALEKLLIPSGWNANITITQSTQMSPQALVDIMENLGDKTGMSAGLLTMGATNLSKLTPEQLLIATAKNWTVS